MNHAVGDGVEINGNLEIWKFQYIRKAINAKEDNLDSAIKFVAIKSRLGNKLTKERFVESYEIEAQIRSNKFSTVR